MGVGDRWFRIRSHSPRPFAHPCCLSVDRYVSSSCMKTVLVARVGENTGKWKEKHTFSPSLPNCSPLSRTSQLPDSLVTLHGPFLSTSSPRRTREDQFLAKTLVLASSETHVSQITSNHTRNSPGTHLVSPSSPNLPRTSLVGENPCPYSGLRSCPSAQPIQHGQRRPVNPSPPAGSQSNEKEERKTDDELTLSHTALTRLSLALLSFFQHTNGSCSHHSR